MLFKTPKFGMHPLHGCLIRWGNLVILFAFWLGTFNSDVWPFFFIGCCCREKSDRPFRCLDCHYRRELVRVYLTNVEQICRRFVEERRSKLGKLLEDKARWSRYFMLSFDKARCLASGIYALSIMSHDVFCNYYLALKCHLIKVRILKFWFFTLLD